MEPIDRTDSRDLFHGVLKLFHLSISSSKAILYEGTVLPTDQAFFTLRRRVKASMRYGRS
jgi:hypothetical protein